MSGPPLAGKTSHVQQHKADGDLVVDWDALAVALGSPVSHGHDDRLRPFVAAARDAVYQRIGRGYDGHVWIVTSDPAATRVWVGAEQVRLSCTREQAHERATEAGRPDTYHAVIDWWFDTYSQ